MGRMPRAGRMGKVVRRFHCPFKHDWARYACGLLVMTSTREWIAAALDIRFAAPCSENAALCRCPRAPDARPTAHASPAVSASPPLGRHAPPDAKSPPAWTVGNRRPAPGARPWVVRSLQGREKRGASGFGTF